MIDTLNNEQVKALLTYMRVGMLVLSARVALLLAMLLSFGLFVWAMADPSRERTYCAIAFTLLVFLPATRIDAKMAGERAAIAPTEGG